MILFLVQQRSTFIGQGPTYSAPTVRASRYTGFLHRMGFLPRFVQCPILEQYSYMAMLEELLILCERPRLLITEAKSWWKNME